MRQLMGDFGIVREFKTGKNKRHQTVIGCLMRRGWLWLKCFVIKFS